MYFFMIVKDIIFYAPDICRKNIGVKNIMITVRFNNDNNKKY